MLSKCMHGWQSGAGRQRVDANPLRGEEGIAANIQRIGSAFGRFDAWDDILGLRDFEPERIKAELDRRRQAWKPPEPRYARGALAKYAMLVGGADQGAVCG